MEVAKIELWRFDQKPNITEQDYSDSYHTNTLTNWNTTITKVTKASIFIIDSNWNVIALLSIWITS